MNTLLSPFHLRPIEKRLYETLFYYGPLGAAALAKRINVSRTAVYDLAERLVAEGLLIESTTSASKRFSAQPPEKLRQLLTDRQQQLHSALTSIEHFQNVFESNRQAVRPRLQLFEGRQALQQMMKDMLLYRDLEVCAVWPIKEMLALLTKEFVERFHRERVERNINLRVIWTPADFESARRHPFLGSMSTEKRVARLAPRALAVPLGYAVYGQTVRFLSSAKENFGFLVESRELSDLMRSQFEVIWDAAKPVKSTRY